MSTPAQEEQPCQAAQAWMELYNAGKRHDIDARNEKWLGIIPHENLETVYPDGSILRWSDLKNEWQWFPTPAELAWRQHVGDA